MYLVIIPCICFYVPLECLYYFINFISTTTQLNTKEFGYFPHLEQEQFEQWLKIHPQNRQSPEYIFTPSQMICQIAGSPVNSCDSQDVGTKEISNCKMINKSETKDLRE